MRACVLALVLAATSIAEASPSWWQQFYVAAGYRDVDGLDRASGRTLALGYRLERRGWGLDLAALDLGAGLDEGLHQVLRLAGYRAWRNLWLGGGVSYAVLDGWTPTTVPHRTGHGLAVDAIAGADLPGPSFVRPFVQVNVTVPTFGAYDRYHSIDSESHVVGIGIAFGVRL